MNVFRDLNFISVFQRVEPDMNVKREYEEKIVHVDINIPDILKKKLEDDCFYINKRKKVPPTHPSTSPLITTGTNILLTNRTRNMNGFMVNGVHFVKEGSGISSVDDILFLLIPESHLFCLYGCFALGMECQEIGIPFSHLSPISHKPRLNYRPNSSRSK